VARSSTTAKPAAAIRSWVIIPSTEAVEFVKLGRRFLPLPSATPMALTVQGRQHLDLERLKDIKGPDGRRLGDYPSCCTAPPACQGPRRRDIIRRNSVTPPACRADIEIAAALVAPRSTSYRPAPGADADPQSVLRDPKDSIAQVSRPARTGSRTLRHSRDVLCCAATL